MPDFYVLSLSLGNEKRKSRYHGLEQKEMSNKGMDDLRFFVLFNSVSVISGRWEVEMKGCVQWSSVYVEKISPRAGIELGRLDQ